jgi:hypothetical protein
MVMQTLYPCRQPHENPGYTTLAVSQNAEFFRFQDAAMRSIGLIAVVVLVAADAGDDAAKKDLEKFQGNWQLMSWRTDGNFLQFGFVSG